MLTCIQFIAAAVGAQDHQGLDNFFNAERQLFGAQSALKYPSFSQSRETVRNIFRTIQRNGHGLHTHSQ